MSDSRNFEATGALADDREFNTLIDLLDRMCLSVMC